MPNAIRRSKGESNSSGFEHPEHHSKKRRKSLPGQQERRAQIDAQVHAHVSTYLEGNGNHRVLAVLAKVLKQLMAESLGRRQILSFGLSKNDAWDRFSAQIHDYARFLAT